MKEKFLGVCLTAVLAGVVAAQEPPAPPEEVQEQGPRQEGFQPMMDPGRGPGMAMGMQMPEKMQEAMAQRGQRRYEIMILLQAYRILPEADRAPVEKAIRERLKADYEEHQAFSKILIARLEKQLAKMKERETKADPAAAVDQEFKRLLSEPIPMFIPGAGPMNGPAMMGPNAGPMNPAEGMMPPRGMGQNNEGRQRQMMRGRRHQEQLPEAGQLAGPQAAPAALPEAVPPPPAENEPKE